MRSYPSFMERLAPWLLWGFVILVFLGGTVLLLASGGFGLFIAGGVLILVVGVALALASWRAIRVTRQRAFLLMLSESIERRIPLIPALQAFGAEYWNWAGRTRRLATALANGIALPDALLLFPGVAAADCLPLLEAGQRSGRLDEAMRRAARQNDRTSPLWQSLAGRLFYLSMLLVVMLGIWTFISLWIVPKFAIIFEDFGARLPWLTRQMIAFSKLAYDFWPVSYLIGLAFVGLFIYGSLCYVGLIACDLPGTRWIVRRLDTATVLDTLALSTEAGRPITEPLAALASRYPRHSLRRRLRRVWIHVAEGGDWCEGLVDARLLRPVDAGVLLSAARVGNLPWALRETADSNRRRFAYRLSAALQIIMPLLLGAVGLVVGLYVIACFLPLISIIEHLAG